MHYSAVTDLEHVPKVVHNDPKESLVKQYDQAILPEVRINQIICIRYFKDKRYYQLVDFALWSKCGHIKTALFLRLKYKNKPFHMKVKTFHGKEQFIVSHNKRTAIYTVGIFAADDKLIGSVCFQKLPNLGACMCKHEIQFNRSDKQ